MYIYVKIWAKNATFVRELVARIPVALVESAPDNTKNWEKNVVSVREFVARISVVLAESAPDNAKLWGQECGIFGRGIIPFAY